MAESSSPRFRAGSFLLAGAVAAAFILSAPFIGEIRRAILQRFPGQFVPIVGGIILVAVAAALVTAIRRIRRQQRRGWRYGGLAASLIVAAAYTYLTRTPDPQVNAVERFHFVEYGVITWLFFRAFRPAGDLSAIVLPIVAGLLVGTVEEWFQWFIPARIGDVRDVFLNGVAICCGLIFSLAFEPFDRVSPRFTPAGLRRIGASVAVLILVFAGFFRSVHVGDVIEGEGWTFKSGHTSGELDRLAKDRGERWRNAFVERPSRLSAEDQYMTEGLWHVQRRNMSWAAGDYASAWHENQILERYFTPVLDTPSYVSKTGHRWSPEHRADAERRFADSGARSRYESTAHPSSIFTFSVRLYWIAASALAVLLLLPWVRGRARVASLAPAVSP